MRDRWIRFATGFALVALLLAACGGGTTTPTGSGDETQDAGGDYTLVNEGRLTVGSDIPYPPFEMEKNGELTGFDVEVVRAVAVELGLENTDDDWISTDFGTIFQQLKAGTKFDIVVAAVTGYAAPDSPAEETVNERLKVVDFTDPYYPSLQSLMVPAGSDIKSVDDLTPEHRVGIQNATTGAFYAEENLDVEHVGFEKAPTMYQSLQGGSLDAVFNDLPVSLDAQKQFPELEVVQQVETGEEYAIAVAKENPALKDAINEALATIYENGTFAEIFSKYFPDQELPPYASE